MIRHSAKGRGWQPSLRSIQTRRDALAALQRLDLIMNNLLRNNTPVFAVWQRAPPCGCVEVFRRETCGTGDATDCCPDVDRSFPSRCCASRRDGFAIPAPDSDQNT